LIGKLLRGKSAGTTNRADYDSRDEILSQLKAALPLTAYCSGCMAPWSRTATRRSWATFWSARAIIGPDCVIGVEPIRIAA
jgi:microcystin degradation protein MlrC